MLEQPGIFDLAPLFAALGVMFIICLISGIAITISDRRK